LQAINHAVKVFYSGPKSEYLERELNWLHADTQIETEFVCGNQEVVLIGPNTCEVLQLFRKKRKVYAYLYADETYKAIHTFLLLINPKVKRILRSYPIHDLRFRRAFHGLQTFLIFMTGKRSIKSKYYFLQGSLAGFIIVLRQVGIYFMEGLRFGKKFEDCWLPLGYTNKFATMFCDYVGEEAFRKSLIEYSLTVNDSFQGDRIFQLVFRGQRGKFQRQEFIRSASDLVSGVSKVFITNDHFGGRNPESDINFKSLDPYAAELFGSTFALCPPGNYSRETFRYWESLLCGCAPITPDFVVSDPLREGLGTSLSSLRGAYSLWEKSKLQSQAAVNCREQVLFWRNRLEKLSQLIK
jgi:hypothetical protein